MSQPTRTSGDAAAAGNPISRNTGSSFDKALILMEEMSDLELPPPAMEPVSHEGERLSSAWRKVVMRRVLDSLHARTRALNDLVCDERSKRLLVGKHHTEFPQSERAELAERVQALREASQLVKRDVWELNELNLAGVNSDTIKELIKSLLAETSDLEFKLNLF